MYERLKNIDPWNRVFYLILFFGILWFCLLPFLQKHVAPIEPIEEPVETTTEQRIDTLTLNKENFFKVCQAYGIDHAEIVYAQARLESGNFTSKVFQERNNMLGLYNSKCKEFYAFNHWTDCLQGYKDLVQYKYQGGDYYKFLRDLPYAQDLDYIQKIQRLTR